MQKSKAGIFAATALGLAMTLNTAYAAEYKASTKEEPLKIVNLNDLELQVKANMDKGAFGYIRGGAEDEKICVIIPPVLIANILCRE